MNKLSFYLKFYKTQKMRFLILVFIFAFAGAILSCSLFLHSNNKKYYDAQIQNITVSNVEALQEMDYEGLFGLMEKVMTIFSLASILIVVWGCTSILFFQNISMQKSYAMLRVFGMRKRDIFCKAWVEGICFGFLGGLCGSAGGYALFLYLSKKLCRINAYVSVFSLETLKNLVIVVFILILISFFGSFISGLYVYETPIVTMLYERKAWKEKQTYIRYALLEFGLLYFIVSAIFYKNYKYINIMLFICVVVLLLLSGVFYFLFHGQTRKRDTGMKSLTKISGISYRFLCTRNKRDALLAATVSVGTIIVCIVLNILFNFSEILHDSFRDNLGYSTIVNIQGLQENGEVEELLDKDGYLYTKIFYKGVPFSEFKGISGNDEIYPVLIVDKQTDENEIFKIPEGSFYAENYGVHICDLKLGEENGIFGKDLVYTKNVSEKQYFNFINFGFIVNRCDWELGLDDTWDTLFLLDLSMAEERELQSALEDEQCRVRTSSETVDNLINILSDYLSIVAVVAVMLVLVTGTFFYSMVRSDLLARKKELYLYQMFGASRKKAFWVVYLEYLMIAWIASFCVVFVTMLLGEILFSLMDTHYPLSIPVVLITVFVVTLFVLVCCFIAQWVNFMGTKMEIIRDE